jgi:uncharacterized protein
LDTKELLVIPYKGLKDGVHIFSFSLDDSFFIKVKYSEIKKGSLKAKIRLDKQPGQLVLFVEIIGNVKVMCDRCLDYFDLQINYNGSLYVKFVNGNENIKEHIEEDSISISNSNKELDITHYIYESICLSIPSQRIHPVNKNGRSSCNKKMIAKILAYSANTQIDNDIDPRWMKLKDINNVKK